LRKGGGEDRAAATTEHEPKRPKKLRKILSHKFSFLVWIVVNSIEEL
jgi:hypothetical protein